MGEAEGSGCGRGQWVRERAVGEEEGDAVGERGQWVREKAVGGEKAMDEGEGSGWGEGSG